MKGKYLMILILLLLILFACSFEDINVTSFLSGCVKDITGGG